MLKPMNQQQDAVQFYGMRRETDGLGRICIPAEFRKLLGFQRKQSVAFHGAHLEGIGNGVFIFATPSKVISGRLLDEIGRVTVPIKMAREYQLEKRHLVEIMPLYLPEFGHGIFVHKVSGACVTADAE